MRVLAASWLVLAACTSSGDLPIVDVDGGDMKPFDAAGGVLPSFGCNPDDARGAVHVRAHAGDLVVASPLLDGPLATVTAGADGTADIEVGGCDSITAIAPDASALFTVMYVAPGETIAPWGFPAAAPPAQLVTVQLPAAGAGATYTASAGGRCTATGATPTLSLPIDASCVDADGTIAILGAALFASPTATLATPVLRAPLSTALATPQELGAFAAAPLHRITAADLTAPAGSSFRASLGGVLGDRAYPAVGATVEFHDQPTMFASLAYPEVGTAALATFTENTVGSVRRTTRRLIAPFDDTTTITADDEYLTTIGVPTWFVSGAQVAVSWSAFPEREPPLGALSLTVTDAHGAHAWRVAFPGAATTVVLPRLPAELVDVVFPATFADAGVGVAAPAGVSNWRSARVGAAWSRTVPAAIPATYRERAAWYGPGVEAMLVPQP